MGIGFRLKPDDPGLQENMFVSNGLHTYIFFQHAPMNIGWHFNAYYLVLHLHTEPGYYENGKFGIRIEDIVQIVPAKIGADFNGRGALTFETITMCPIETKLIDANLLTEKEVRIITI